MGGRGKKLDKNIPGMIVQGTLETGSAPGVFPEDYVTNIHKD